MLIGGSPNPSGYEQEVHAMAGPDVIFAGFVYGDDVTRLMLNAYCYIQPSDVEGLSPVVLTVMGLGVPLIVSDIDENLYAVQDTAITFKKADPASLTEQIQYAEQHYPAMQALAAKAQQRAGKEFNWDTVTEQHETIFSGNGKQ